MFPHIKNTSLANSMKLPTVSPALSSAGLQTIQASPVYGVHNPVLPPPIPLLPPSLFSPHPSLPDMRNPAFSDWYWGRMKDPLKGDYTRESYGRGGGFTSLLGRSSDPDAERLKKTLYRNDLQSQIEGNRVKRIEQYK